MQDPIFTPIFTAALTAALPASVSAATIASAAGLLSGVATAALTTGIGMLLAPDPPKPEDGFAPINEAVPDRIYGYGTVRLAGKAMLWEEWKRNFWAINAIAGHRIHDIRGHWLDEERITIDEDGWVQYAPRSKRFGKDGDYVRIGHRLGLPVETAYANFLDGLAGTGMYGEDFRGDGQASVSMYLRRAAAKFFGKVYGGGIPKLSSEVDMARVWDFRDEDQDPEDEDTWVFSTNPVLIAAHYLCFSTFGYRHDFRVAIEPLIDEWIEEADICDEAVPRKSGGTEKRYQCAHWFVAGNEKKAVMNAIMASCDGWWTELGSGAVRVRVGKVRDSGIVITDADITGFFLQTDQPIEDEVNRLIPQLTYPAADYATAEVDAFEDVDSQLRRGLTLDRTMDLITVQEWRQARRLGKREWERLRQRTRGSLDLRLSGINAAYERWWRVRSAIIPRMDDILVENRNGRLALAKGGFSIEFVGCDGEPAWDPETDEGEPPPVPPRPADDEQYIPQDLDVVAEAVTIGSGVTGIYLAVSFDDPGEEDLDYEVWYRVKVVSGPVNSWTVEKFTEVTPSGGRIRLTTATVPADETVEVKVYSRSGSTLSDPSTTEEVDTSADTVAPAPPTFGTVSATGGTVATPLRAPNSANVKRLRLWRVTTGGGFGSATDVSGAINCSPNQNFPALDDTPGSAGTWDYYATAENASGVGSSPAGPETATTT